MALGLILNGAVCLRDKQVLSSHTHTTNKAKSWPRLLGTAISSKGMEGREGRANLSMLKMFCFDFF